MDKTSRLTFASGNVPGDTSPQNVQLMALVIGVMSAVTAEVERTAQERTDNDHLAEMVKLLPKPDPNHRPDQVLKIQLAALKANDIPSPNHGIALAHRFCTAESRALLGAPKEFVQLFRDPMYSPLLNFQAVNFGSAYEKQNRVSIRFTVTAADGAEAHYIAHLVKETSGPDTDCWMTDSILRRCG